LRDWKNRGISQKDLSRSMSISYVSGALGIMWLVTATPQQILTVFIRNYLEATSTQLGLLVGTVNALALLNLAAIWFYGLLKGQRKPFFILTTLIQRSAAFLIAFAAFGVASGGDKDFAIRLVLVAGIIGALFGSSSGSGWWSWMADLIPEARRSAFFGRRSAISQFVNVIFFFSATFAVDLYAKQAFVVYGILFSLGALAGLGDILLHIFIPEPKPLDADVEPMTWREFFRPLRDRSFRQFCIVLGMYLFSFNLAAPFLAPFMTSPTGGGAPTVWLGITFVISQLTWVLMAPFWGMLMDRMGKKPIVMIGGLMVISWVGYLFLGPSNYPFVLPLIALVGGFFAPAFWEGISQFMIALSPDENRTAYSAWYWTAFGVSASVSPLLGGVIYDYLELHPLIIGRFAASPFQTVVSLSIVLVLFSLTHLGRITTLRDKSVRAVVGTILNPGIFRAVTNISILGRPTRALVVQRTLEDSRGGALDLGFAEISIRLDDPVAEVREAAIQAMVRLGTPEAVHELVSRLSSSETLSRPKLARALGLIPLKNEALKEEVSIALSLALQDPSEELEIEAAGALGRIQSQGSRGILLDFLRRSDSLKVKVSSAGAAAQLGLEEAAEEIFFLLFTTENWILRRQLAIALGDLFGTSGEMYQYMTGDWSQNVQSFYQLAEQSQKRLDKILGRVSGRRVLLGLPINRHLEALPVYYEKGEFAAAFRLELEVWGEIERHPGVKAIIPSVVRMFWDKTLGIIEEGNEPKAQEVVLGLYGLYRCLYLAENNRRVMTAETKTVR